MLLQDFLVVLWLMSLKVLVLHIKDSFYLNLFIAMSICLVGSQSEVRLFFQSVIVAFFPKHFQLCNKSLITQACCDLHHKNIGPQSPLYGPCCTLSILSRPRTNIFPVWSSCLVNNIYIQCIALVYLYGIF